jgi:hypothetical protein
VRGLAASDDQSDRRPPWSRGRAADGTACLCLVLATAVLYGGVLDLWWSWDDFFQLRYTAAWSPLQYGLDPAVWRLLPTRMVTPLLFASYDLDLALFGPDPRAFYLHQLTALALLAVAIHLTLRRWLEPLWAAATALLVLLGAPIASLAPLLMVRHYTEAILLGAISVALWVRALDTPPGPRRAGLAAASAVAWLAASLAKEIAVPLVLLLPALPVA